MNEECLTRLVFLNEGHFRKTISIFIGHPPEHESQWSEPAQGSSLIFQQFLRVAGDDEVVRIPNEINLGRAGSIANSIW